MIERILFVCSANLQRSPTAEQLFSTWPGIKGASAGVFPEAAKPLSLKQVRWADMIIVMEEFHREAILERFEAHLAGKQVICLGIPDRYAYMDPELVELMRKRVTPHLPR